MAAIPQGLQAALADRYRLERELGRGGMATVYLAEDLKHQRPVALKVLHPEITALLGSERFLREIGTAARLTHPHILPLHDSGEASGFLYYVMPYVEGESLRDRLDRERQLSADDAVRIAADVAGALDYAHRHGVVHRDVKPENILLEEGHAVVADFGIARAIDAAGGGKLTTTGVVLGTPIYMSPEQALGGATLDGRSDIYSMGCVLYEMLAGQPPFTGPTSESVIHQHLSLEPRPISALRPAVAAGVGRALERALAKTPADRFGTAAEFREALQAAGTQGVPAEPSTPAPRAPSPPRRNVLLPIAGLIALVATLVVGGALLHPGVRGFLENFGVPTGPPSLAVLYFQNFGAAGDDDYLAAGLTEEVTTRLSQIRGLRVMSRSGVERYRGRAITPQQVRRDLHVGYMLEGSIRRAGDELRVTSQLIRTSDGSHVWAGRYDGKLAGIFAVQDTIASRIASALQVAIGPEEQAGINRRWTEDAQAYAHYLTGREIFFDGGRAQPVADARPWFEKALALDPEYAPAMAGLADILVSEWQIGRRVPNQLDTAIEMARKAQKLDPSLGVAWRAEARALMNKGQRKRALELLEHALEVSPRTGETYRTLTFLYAQMGQRDRAEAALRGGITVDPDLPNSYSEAISIYRDRGAYAEADKIVAEGLARLPDHPLLLVARAGNLEAERRYSEATEILKRILDRRPGYYRAYPTLATVLRGAHADAAADSVYRLMVVKWPDVPAAVSLAGWNEMTRKRYAAAESLLHRALRLEPDYYYPRRDLARCYLNSGKTAEAERAYLDLAKRWPNDAEACEDIARGYFDLKRYGDAEAWAKRSLQMSPERLSACEQLAWDYNAQGKYDAAIAQFRKAIALRSDAWWIYRGQSIALQNAGRFREGAAMAQRSLELKPDYYDGFMALGNAYFNMHDRFQAAAAYEKAVALDSTNARALVNLANIYLTEERAEKAIEMYQHAARLDTTNALVWGNIASSARIYLRDSTLARDAARTCMARGKSAFWTAAGYYDLGMVEDQLGRPAAARALYAKGLAEIKTLTPAERNWPIAHATTGLLCARCGDAAGARREAEWLVRTRPDSPDDLYAAACIMGLCGDRDRGLEYLKRAVAAGYDDKGLMKRDPDLAGLRGHPGFDQLVASLR